MMKTFKELKLNNEEFILNCSDEERKELEDQLRSKTVQPSKISELDLKRYRTYQITDRIYLGCSCYQGFMDELNNDMSLEDFKQYIVDTIKEYLNDFEIKTFEDNDIIFIHSYINGSYKITNVTQKLTYESRLVDGDPWNDLYL